MQPNSDRSPRMFESERGFRAIVELECEVRQGTAPWRRVRLEDISPQGFRLSWFPNCRRDLPLRIRIPGLALLTAHVRWQENFEVGCQFEASLHYAVFDHLVRHASQGE